MTTVHIATAAGRSVSWKVPDSGAPFAVQRIPSLVQVAAPAAAPTSAAAKNHDGAADNDPPSVAICNVHDYQRLARSWLSKPLYEYLASGTDDEQTLSQNIDAFKQYFLRPRVMRPVGSISTVTRLFGRTLSSPVFVSPAGVHALCEPREGECATARACARVGTLFGLSQHSTRTIEEVADAVVSSTSDGNANLWYQAYILRTTPSPSGSSVGPCRGGTAEYSSRSIRPDSGTARRTPGTGGTLSRSRTGWSTTTRSNPLMVAAL